MKYKLNPSYHGGSVVKLLNKFFNFICIFIFILNLFHPSTINAYCFYNNSQDNPVIEVDVYSNSGNANLYKGMSEYATNIFTAVFFVFTGIVGSAKESTFLVGKEAAAIMAEQAAKEAAIKIATKAAEKAGATVSEQALKEIGEQAAKEAGKALAEKAAAAAGKTISRQAAELLENSKQQIANLVDTTKQNIKDAANTAVENLKKVPNVPSAIKTKVLQFAEDAKNLTADQVKQAIVAQARFAKTGVTDFLNKSTNEQAKVLSDKVFDVSNVGAVVAPVGEVVAGTKGNVKAAKAFNIANRIFNDLTMPGSDLQELFDLLGAKVAHHEIATGESACWNWKDIQNQLSHPTILASIASLGTQKGTKNIGSLYFEVTDGAGATLYNGDLIIFCSIEFNDTGTIKQSFPFLDNKGREYWKLLQDGFTQGYYLNPYVLPSLIGAEDFRAFNAVAANNIDDLQQAIHDKANLNNNYLSLKFSNTVFAFIGKTPLHLATKNKNIAMINALLAAGANPNMTTMTITGANEFMPAAAFDSAQLQREISMTISGTGNPYPTGITPFTMALANKNKEIINLFLPKLTTWCSTDVSSYLPQVKTGPYFGGLAIGSSSMPELLNFPSTLSNGNANCGTPYLNFNAQEIIKTKPMDLDKALALYKAAFSNTDLNTTISVAFQGIVTNMVINGTTLLHTLIQKHQDPDSNFKQSQEILITALLWGGAKPTIKDQNGQTALDLATQLKDSQIIALINNTVIHKNMRDNAYTQRMQQFPNEKKAIEFLITLQETDTLSAAVERNDLNSVNSLIKNGISVNILSNGLTPLHRAVIKSNAAMVQALIAAGANRSCFAKWWPDYQYKTAYEIAQQLNNPDIIAIFDDLNKKEAAAQAARIAAQQKADGDKCSSFYDYLNNVYINNDTVAFSSDTEPYKNLMQFLQHSTNVNGLGKDNNTLLHAAIMLRTLPVINVNAQQVIMALLANGADATIKNNNGQSPLDLAIKYDPSFSLDRILRQYPNLQSVADASKASQTSAVSTQDAKQCQTFYDFLNNGYKNNYLDPTTFAKLMKWLNTSTNVNGLCAVNNTLLHAAIMLHTVYAQAQPAAMLIQKLLAKGADATIKNNNGETPLNLAIRVDPWSRDQILQKYPHLQQVATKTVQKQDAAQCKLYYNSLTAAYNNRYFTPSTFYGEFMNWLKSSTNINALCTDNNTLLHAAIKLNTIYPMQKNAQDFIKTLLARGADVAIKNINGETPLDLAKRVDSWSRDQILQKYPNLGKKC